MRVIMVITAFFLGLSIGLYAAGGVYLKCYESERHIEYLEEFIQDNGLPTPARQL